MRTLLGTSNLIRKIAAALQGEQEARDAEADPPSRGMVGPQFSIRVERRRQPGQMTEFRMRDCGQGLSCDLPA